MIVQPGTDRALAGPFAGSQATREARLGDVGLIVLDEVHYLGDPHRGSVWEEVIINCPRHIQLLCMSATVKNPEDLGSWISKVGAGRNRGGEREGAGGRGRGRPRAGGLGDVAMSAGCETEGLCHK